MASTSSAFHIQQIPNIDYHIHNCLLMHYVINRKGIIELQKRNQCQMHRCYKYSMKSCMHFLSERSAYSKYIDTPTPDPCKKSLLDIRALLAISESEMMQLSRTRDM